MLKCSNVDETAPSPSASFVLTGVGVYYEPCLQKFFKNAPPKQVRAVKVVFDVQPQMLPFNSTLDNYAVNCTNTAQSDESLRSNTDLSQTELVQQVSNLQLSELIASLGSKLQIIVGDSDALKEAQKICAHGE